MTIRPSIILDCDTSLDLTIEEFVAIVLLTVTGDVFDANGDLVKTIVASMRKHGFLNEEGKGHEPGQQHGRRQEADRVS